MPDQRLLRVVTTLLLLWIGIDLAAIDTCALDIDSLSRPAQGSLAPQLRPATPAHPHAVLHPDHCFCHGISIGASAAGLINPISGDGALIEAPPGHLRQASSALYHPPQLPA